MKGDVPGLLPALCRYFPVSRFFKLLHQQFRGLLPGEAGGLPRQQPPFSVITMFVYRGLLPRWHFEELLLVDADELPLLTADLILPDSVSSGKIRGISSPGMVLTLSRL
jgi:hypothetical protein